MLAICAALVTTSSTAFTQTKTGAAILVYHRFGPVAAATTVSVASLDEQLSWLAAHTHVAPLRAVVEALRSGASVAGRTCVAITADDGHRSVFTDLYPRILRYRLPITLFIYPSAISNAPYALTWSQLAEMAGSGLVDVQSHTYWHPNFSQEKARRSPDSYREFVNMQLLHSKQVLEEHMDQRVDMLAWPFGIHDAELEAAAMHSGYVAGFLLGNRAVQPGDDLLALPRFWISDSDGAAHFATMLATCRTDSEAQ